MGITYKEAYAKPLLAVYTPQIMNLILVFIFGLLVGSSATYFYAKSYWIKRLKVTKQRLFVQYDSDIRAEQQHRQQLENREGQWLRQHEESANRESALAEQLEAKARSFRQRQVEYEKRLAAEKQVSLRLQDDYEARLGTARGDRAKLQSEYDGYKLEAKANVDESLQESLTIEQRNRALDATNKQLENEKKVLESALCQEREQHQKSLEQAYQEPNVDFGKIISELFPNVKLMRDSLCEINKNKRNIGTILCRLQALNNRDFSYSKKLHATSNDWSECRAPHMKLLRIYYRKEKRESGGCEVLISYKKDSKTQDKDVFWLKLQPKKP